MEVAPWVKMQAVEFVELQFRSWDPLKKELTPKSCPPTPTRVQGPMRKHSLYFLTSHTNKQKIENSQWDSISTVFDGWSGPTWRD